MAARIEINKQKVLLNISKRVTVLINEE